MKVSIITAVYNGEKYIRDCVESVIAQNHRDIEYIVIDGASSDQTLEILTGYKDQIHVFISESDHGIYDALNKGIVRATGDIVGILHADDTFASNAIIKRIVRCFEEHPAAEGIHGNLNYVHPENPNRIIRKWKSKELTKSDLRLGWMPAHPTLYLRKGVFDRYGKYSLDAGTAADYEFMMRLLYQNNQKLVFLDDLIVNMRNGGMSNLTLKSRWQALIHDYRTMKMYHFPSPLLTLALKKLSKLSQFLAKKD